MDILVKEVNNAPSAEQLSAYLKDNFGRKVKVADAKRSYWQNDRDTLVIKLDTLALDFIDGLALGKLPYEFNADEFDSINEDGETYYRIWWD